MPTSNDLNDLESQVKKSKISAASFRGKNYFVSGKEIANVHKTIGNLAGHVRKTVIKIGTLEKIVNNQSKKITSLKNISKTQSEKISGTNIGAKLPGSSADNLNKTIVKISDAVSSIVDTLKVQKKISDAASENERKKAEREKRGLVESKLEKVFGGIINTAQKIIAPVKNLLDRILDFIGTVILGRIVYKLVGWLGDPKNKDKVNSIIRFVKDWWPALLGAYVIFGTSFGRFTTKIIGMVARFAIQIATKAIPGLITLARRNPATAALAIGATTYLTNQALNQPDKNKQPDNQPVQKLASGGYVRPRKFSGGGFAGLRRLFGLAGGGVPGYVSGQKGVDKIPAMLSDGEFVMSRGAVQKYGVDTLEGMNAAGGGTNRPKIMGGVHHAAGGGMIGGSGSGRPEYREQYDRTHGAGAYDKELARRRAITDAQDNADIALKNNLQNWRQRSSTNPSTQKRASGDRKITVNGINVTGLQGLRRMGPNVTITRDNRMTPEMQAKLVSENKKSAAMDALRASKEDLRKKARAEYNKIINNPDDPRYQDAWDGKLKISDLQKQLQSTPPAPTAKPTAPTQGLQSAYRAAGMGSYSASNIIRAQNQTANGKYYSSSNQKTYGNYNDALAAKKSRMTSLASQQRLDKLSSKGAGPKTGRGIRYNTENLARQKEWDKRGGDWGGFTRGLTRLFTATPDKINSMRAEDKASDARVKQAGAASIGRYYSSSDGKYYKDFNTAKLAREQRMKSGVKPPVKPKPTTGGGAGVAGSSGGGYSANRGSSGSKPPAFNASTKGFRSKTETLGLMR